MSNEPRSGDGLPGRSNVHGYSRNPTPGGNSNNDVAAERQDFPAQPLSQQRGYRPRGQQLPDQGYRGYVQGQPGQNPPGQQGQYPQGQPPQYPQGQQQGWNQQHQQYQQGWSGGQVEPPKKSNTVMIVAVIAIAVALILGGALWFVMAVRANEAVPTPALTTSVATKPTEDSITLEPTGDPTGGSSDETTLDTTTPDEPVSEPTEGSETNGQTSAGTGRSVMPSTVGEFVSTDFPDSVYTEYSDPAGDTMVVVWADLDNVGISADDLEDVVEIGSWTCGTTVEIESSTLCLGMAQQGILLVGGDLFTIEEVAAFGEEFLTIWK